MPFVNNNGIKIYYIVEGQGPSIVMLHGGPGSHQEWYSYVNLLKDKYQLILLDLRGNGQSDKPHDSELYSSRKFTMEGSHAFLFSLIFWFFNSVSILSIDLK